MNHEIDFMISHRTLVCEKNNEGEEKRNQDNQEKRHLEIIIKAIIGLEKLSSIEDIGPKDAIKIITKVFPVTGEKITQIKDHISKCKSCQEIKHQLEEEFRKNFVDIVTLSTIIIGELAAVLGYKLDVIKPIEMIYKLYNNSEIDKSLSIIIKRATEFVLQSFENHC